MTKRHVHDLFDERALQLLDDKNYWRIVQCVIDDLVYARIVFENLHVQSFVFYGLLAMSPLGGFCWPGAEKFICAQTYGDVAHVIENGVSSPTYLTVFRKGINYPIFIHPVVEYALLVFVYQRMRVQTVRNNAPGPIQLSDHLAPMNPRSRTKDPNNQYAYRVGLLNAYLEDISTRLDIRIPPTVSGYLATGRSLLVFQYDLDVACAMLGVMDCSIPPTEQLLESLMVVSEESLYFDKAKPDPAYQIIFQLRTYTDRVRCRRDPSSSRREQADKVKKWLQEAHESLSTLDTPGSANALLIVAWLQDCFRKNSINTLHNKLDDVIAFLGLIGYHPIEKAMQVSECDALYPPQRDPAKLRRYFSSLRSLYRFATKAQGWKRLPDGLKYRQPDQITEEHFLTVYELANLIMKIPQAAVSIAQHPYTKIPVADYLVAMTLLCSFSALRISEALRLCLGDIWVTDRLTITVLRKRRKRITTEIPKKLTSDWVLDFLRSFWESRYRELDGDLGGRLLVGALFSLDENSGGADDGRAYYRLKVFFESIDFADGFHVMRRFFANQARLKGLPLLQIVNLLGHSTTTTAPRSYIQIYPFLQNEQFGAWVVDQDHLVLPEKLGLKNVAALLGVSREGAFKMLVRAKMGNEGGLGRATPVPLDDLIQMLCYRVRSANQ